MYSNTLNTYRKLHTLKHEHLDKIRKLNRLIEVIDSENEYKIFKLVEV